MHNSQVYIDGNIYPSNVIDPKIHIFIGMFRSPFPPNTEYLDEETGEIKRAGYIACPCGHMLGYVEAVRDHWQLGHFDIPQYMHESTYFDKLTVHNKR